MHAAPVSLSQMKRVKDTIRMRQQAMLVLD